jgi:hypothetical protein
MGDRSAGSPSMPVVDVARRKHAERGGFDVRLWLDGVDPAL